MKRLRWLRAPLWLRVFGFQFLVVIGVTMIVMQTFGNEAQRTLVRSIAPSWSSAIRTALAEQPAGQNNAVATYSMPQQIRVRVADVPPSARRIEHEARHAYVLDGFRAVGLPVVDVRLQDNIDEPVTWIAVRGDGGELRWVGVIDGMQVPNFMQRWWLALLLTLMLLGLLAWWQSRRVVWPINRLMKSLDVIARGEVPQIKTGGPPELRRLGSALESMAHDAADRDAQRRLMLAGISHDLRSPLARIRLAADLMEHEPAARERIMNDVDLADRMLGEFLLYVRAEAETLDDDVDLIALARAAARAHGLSENAVTAGTVPTVRGHALLLRRAIDNLLDNARQHGAAPITVRVFVDEGMAICAVSDAGRGIAKHDVARLLRPFERGELHRGTPGTGLGLAIVERIARKHGGSLRIESGMQGGACVLLCVPFVQSSN